MASLVALCSGLGKRKFTRFPAAFVCLTNPGTRAVLWRSCSQYEQVTSNEDLLLSQFISPFTGCIYGRHITGLCGKKQKEITKAIKRAQILGFMPVTYKDPAYLKDPKVCNIKYRE
ncbi:28S ribosomal protein S18c, mitochondrial isoform X2 [Cervus elaphus]|uniref:28S ribosomal protein S18c, mitochondrial isoform X2 n=1 Tax=Cervus canadensis TaxID=1574408 RepID=UPI0018B645CF|nr:28S ribosomal protein S18c, mitochondrial isoform X2 [Cervus canadensis]XP_043762243.1 28S ribosomal protein S18c, mitochondrial isoform X2 [Cervus elaphus]